MRATSSGPGSLARAALAAACVLALVAVSVSARVGSTCCSGGCAADRRVGADEPPAELTGAVLVDLADDIDDATRDAIEAELVAAIGPYPWPAGDAALGDELSDPANLFRLTPPASEIADVLATLSDDSVVEAVEVEGLWDIGPEATAAVGEREVAPADREDRFIPDDPYYQFQWHLEQIGMPEAWSHSRGGGAVVAVIDTGVAYRTEGRFAVAPDLAATRFVDGFDFVDNDAFPDDEHGHGTHVAGTVAQATNNGLGVAGVAPEAAIMPIRVLDARGSGGWGAIAAGIRFAADNGAHVINMSLGGGARSRTVERAIQYAHERGVVVIAAAGNASRDTVEYPARHDHVVAVGAVRFDRELSFYSSYGEGLDVVAPGGDLRVDQNGDGMPDGVLQNTIVGGNPSRFDYLAWQGTSMATPHVAGIAALIRARGVTDPDAVESILQRSAVDLGNPHRFGSGLVQASRAVEMAGTDRSAARGLVALAGSLFVLFALRRQRRLAVGLVSTTAIAVVLAGGLGVLPWNLIGLGGVGAVVGEGVPGLAAVALGPNAGVLALSALVPVALVLLLLQQRRALPIIVGVCLGVAAWLVVEAISPSVFVDLLPAWAIGPWLVLNALVALAMGRQAAAREH